MDIEFAVLTLDKLGVKDLKSNDQLKKHSIDPSLDDKPIERAQHLLTVGEEVQRLSVIQSIPDLLAINSTECIEKIVPKMQQALPTGSTEYHMLASQTIKTVIQKNLIPMDTFIETFLHPILASMDNRDPIVSNAWIETMMDILDFLPDSVIQSQITPVALARTQGMKSIPFRMSNIRLLGSIAKRYDSTSIKRDLLPSIISLCQDCNYEVRACMCLQLPGVAERLGDDATKSNLLPALIELATDDTSSVKEATLTTIVSTLHVFSTDVLKTTLVPMLKQMVIFSLKYDTSLMTTMASLFGKMCLGIERAVPSQEKDAYVKWYSAFAQLGAHSKKSARSSDYHSNSFADAYALCRQYCAYNFPAMACFCRNDANLLTKSLHVIFYDLTLDTYYMVRKTIACGLHEVIYLYTKNCAILKPDFLRLLKDESEDVLEGLIPNITECLSHFVRNGVFGHALMDPSTSELVRSLMKCESVIAGTHNWRLHTTLFEQFECLYSVLPSDILFANFVTLLFNRFEICRAVPTRLAVVKTLLVILRYLPKAQQRSEIRNRIINDLCMSRSFYDRMMFVRSCDVMFDKFSTTYFKEHFFVKTVSLTEDPVANVRWATACLLPKLKAMARLPGDVRLQQLVEAAVERLSVDPDPEVLRKMEEVKQQMDKVEFGKTFPNDQKKMEEERALSSSTDHKDMPTAADPLPSNHEPRSVYRTTGEFGGSSSVEDGSSTPRRRVERYPPAPGTRMTTPSTTTVASSSGSLRTSIPPRSTHYSKPPTSAQLSFTDREFLVDTGVRLLREVNAGNTKVFREPVYARQTVTRTKTTKQSEDSKGSTGRTTPNRKPQQQSSFPIPAPKNAPQGIPVPRTPRGNRSGPTTPPGANRRLGGNLPPSHQKRHSLEVMDLNSNGENSRPDKTEAEGKSETVTNDNDNSGSGMGDNNNGRQGLTGGAARRQSHLPRPLSCINFPVKPLEGIKPVNQRLSSRLPVSRPPDARFPRRT